ncbi:hypothetical protein Tco_1575090 [Tanacetum coccineum]
MDQTTTFNHLFCSLYVITHGKQQRSKRRPRTKHVRLVISLLTQNEASSEVTYTSISSYYEEPSDKGSLGVVVYGYDGLPMHPVDPPLSDYVSGPEEPEQALLSPDYVPRPKYPKYLAPSNEEVHVDSPIALYPGYIADSDPKEDLEDGSEDGLVDYPTDGRDDDEDDDDDSSRDDADDEEEEEDSDKDEEEEHLAHANSTAAASLVVDIVPSAEETKPFETDESAAVDRLLAIPTPLPSPLTPLSSPLPQILSPPLPVPSPLATSPTYAEAPLGLRKPRFVDRREDIPEADILPQKRLCLTAPTPRFEVGKSSAAVAARHPGLGVARTSDYDFADMVDDAPRHHVPREDGCGITDTWDALVDAIQEGAPTTLEGVNARVIELAETYERDTQDLYAHMEDAQDI